MKKLITLLILLLIVPMQLPAKEYKTLYEKYEAKLVRYNIQPDIEFLDDENWEARVNKDFLRSFDMAISAMEEMELPQPDPWYLTKEAFYFYGIVTAVFIRR